MKSISENAQVFRQFLTLIERMFGEKCEVALHDLKDREYDSSIVDIRNGHVSGRKPGDSGGNWGLEVLSGAVTDGDRFNRLLHSKDGRVVRSSTIFIKGDEGEIIGAICVNLDITETVRFEEYLRSFNQSFSQPGGEQELFLNDVNELLDNYINQCRVMIGKEPADMSKEEKLQVVRFLDSKGAFLITRSGDKVCDFLGISKFTLYSYLDTVRCGAEEKTGKS